ncbi:hypothetical protein SAMN05216436_102119 [bacterium A37T11]|nr:hypothetical protein SAMN05216436_102119 [bacterium A37T11]
MQLPYLLEEKDKLTYQLVTDQGITYLIYFLDYSNMFEENPLIASYVFTLNIDVVDGDIKNALQDERIRVTVSEVLRLFFEEIDNVAIYICDSMDSRQLARKRKFDFWFWKYNDGSIFKEDGIAVIEDMGIYNSILLHRQNSNFDSILHAFRKLNDRDYQNK